MLVRTFEPMFKLVAVADDQGTGEFYAVIEFRDRDGNLRSIHVPIEEMDDRKALKSQLKKYGAYFSRSPEANATALAELNQPTNQVPRWTFARALGWRDGHSAFVSATGTIAKASPGIKLMPPVSLQDCRIAKMGRRGTIAAWSRAIAPAKYSSRMVFSVCTALAATVLSFAKLNSFIVLLHGPAKGGKSTTLVVAGSVSGFAREEDLPNFRSTDAALGEIPAMFNDSMLPLNELALLKGRPMERRARLRDLSYGVAEGGGTRYSSMVASAPPRTSWRSIVFATGEESSDDLARDVGEIRLAGEAVRCIDLPATRGSNLDVFDRAPDDIPADERTKWVEAQCEKLRRACRRNHGVALKHFVSKVIRRPKYTRRQLRALRSEFISMVERPADDMPVRHLAKYFGHIYAAGMLAVRFGTLPWPEALIKICLLRCYRDARLRLNSESELLRKGLRTLHLKLRSLGRWRLKPGATPANLDRAAGYLRPINVFWHHATIRAEMFKSWFDDPRQPRLVLDWLRGKNLLPAKPSAPARAGTGIVWAESQPTWPNGSRVRSIEIKFWLGLFASRQR